MKQKCPVETSNYHLHCSSFTKTAFIITQKKRQRERSKYLKKSKVFIIYSKRKWQVKLVKYHTKVSKKMSFDISDCLSICSSFDACALKEECESVE